MRSGNHGTQSRTGGFTLIEMLIGMTIMALVVTVLYSAFSTAASTWRRQEGRTHESMRLLRLHQILRDDILALVPYQVKLEEDNGLFLAGSPSVLFYTTRNGFGSNNPARKGLFFTCVFVAETEQGQAIHLYKNPLPQKEILRQALEFKQTSSGLRPAFEPSSAIREQSIMVLDGLEQASFVFAKEDFVAFEGTEPFDEFALSEQSEGAYLEEWVEDEFPGQLLFLHTYRDKSLRLRLPILPPEGINATS